MVELRGDIKKEENKKTLLQRARENLAQNLGIPVEQLLKAIQECIAKRSKKHSN